MADLLAPLDVAAVCRWCGAPAGTHKFVTDYYCDGCRYTTGACRCDRRSPPMAPEQQAIIPLQPWGASS
ncbi:MAG: hypothetical protein Q8R78_04970 [Candidatus Omnitrophota bacterium]|nr:hypothetical protein [Candidatus Omnitrophota bacterium]